MDTHELKILAIDDNQDNLTALRVAIADAFPGARVFVALNARAGIESALAEDPDVILLDIVLSGVDGFEVCRNLKQDQRLRLIPVVFLTAPKTDRESRIRALEAGAEAFLPAPPDEQELTAQIRTMAKIKAANVLKRDHKEQLARLVEERTRELEQELTERKQAEESLNASEVRYRRLFETAKDGILILDAETGMVVDANPFLIEMLGYSHEQFLGKRIWELGFLKDSIANWDNFLQLQQQEYIRYEDLPLETAGGRRFNVEFVSNVYLVDHTKVIQCNIRDITARKKAEQALAESENRYRNLIMHSPDAIFVSQEDRVILVNHACMRLFGAQSAEELIGKPPCDLFHPDFQEQVRERIKRLLELGEPVPPLEQKVVRLDGGIVDVEVIAASFTVGGIMAIHIILHDITERKQAEAEHERLMSAIEQAGEIIIITDPEGKIQYVNPAFVAVTGYTRQEALGQSTRILKSGKQDEAFYRKLWETITSGQTWEGRIVNKRKDGGLYTEDATISPVCDTAGRIANYVAVERDITEHLRLESQFLQVQKMESVGRLAGGVAHDFNNMLSVILGYTELALSKVEQTHPLHANLQEVFNAAERSAGITRQLLAFARKQTIVPEVLDLNEIIEGMLKMLRRLIGEDIDLAWLPEKGLCPVKMDPSQLNQILANLCVNARDAISDVGKITIETGSLALDETYCDGHAGFVPGEYVLLAVSDDGYGMDKETLDNIFEPFFTTKEVGRGTGLGLATVYGIVKQNDGFINVYSEPGKGTTFKIYLPRHMSQGVEPRGKSAVEIPLGQGEIVLVVEDEVSILQLAEKILAGLGYVVLTAGTPSEALSLAEAHTGEIHLLITDVVLPEMNGRDLAARLRASRPAIKCLFMSGYTADAIAHRGVLDEGIQFIQKPFTAAALATKVRTGLDQQ